MKCVNVMSKAVKWITPDETALKAARLMSYHSVGLLPVCDAEGVPVGVITDRDIALRVVAEGRAPGDTRVDAFMSRDIVFCHPEAPLSEVETLMVVQSVSRVIVIDPETGKLAGVVSLADVLEHDRKRSALKTARGIVARETADRREGEPSHAADPKPEYFHGAREAHEAAIDEAPRTVADRAAVIRGGSNKLFPS